MSDFGKDINVHSKDTVYRQDVEDMLQNALPSRGMWEIEGDVAKNTNCETVADLMMDLEKLPSAQPEQRSFSCGQENDSISRQAAIEIVDFECGGELIGTAKIITTRLSDLPPAQPESYKVKLKEIADALSEKFAYMNTCLNERDIILGYLGVKRRCKTHCNTDCTNTKCESHPLSSAQPEQRWVPCEVRLPEKSGQYYVSGGDKVWICEFLIIPNFTGGWCNDARNPVVQAWMPLPEPYKGE